MPASQTVMPAPPLRPVPPRRWPFFIGVAAVIIITLFMLGYMSATAFERHLPAHLLSFFAQSDSINLQGVHTQSIAHTPTTNTLTLTLTPKLSSLSFYANTHPDASGEATLTTLLDSSKIVFRAHELDSNAHAVTAPTASTILAHALPSRWWQLDLEPSPLRDTLARATFAYSLTCWRDILTAARAHPDLFAAHPFLRLERASDAPIKAAPGQIVYQLYFDSDAVSAYLQILPSQIATTCDSDIWTTFVTPETQIYVTFNLYRGRPVRFYLTAPNQITDVTLTDPQPSLAVPAASSPATLLANTTLAGGDVIEINTTAHTADYVTTTTADKRNRDRIFDLETAADALDACQTAGGYYGDMSTLSRVIDRDTDGPFATRTNPCLSHDLAPALVAYPYTYSLYPDRGAYVLCAALELEDDWLGLGNSRTLLRSLEDVENARACQPDDKTCYYCVARTN